MAAILIRALSRKETFDRDFRRAPVEIQNAAKNAIRDLMRCPQPSKLRMHSITGCFDPRILKIDVLANKSWQITFEMDGSVAILRRLGTHRNIDRSP
ncbi:hypothetical protein KYT87_10785 [Achromobacter sp. ES-001]|uniref:hypothetical protein n=1 Tax=Achromobacter sp. ES-001 TaxID=2860286 RepID=UPI001C63EE85|nr:hypothetical protein [Achromobacter sp. ES-001]QYJ23656.1 hypothetical protein KYT87_10785 [Achromobacter sp. ES-001]